MVPSLFWPAWPGDGVPDEAVSVKILAWQAQPAGFTKLASWIPAQGLGAHLARDPGRRCQSAPTLMLSALPGTVDARLDRQARVGHHLPLRVSPGERTVPRS